MSTRTTNYNFIIGEGSDVVNPLTQIFPNFTSLDDILRSIANTGITTATELVTGTVHALTRTDANVSVFRFQATGNFTAGETFTVDGAQVTALDVSGETLRTGAYIIGSMVLCELRDTLLTVYTSGSTDAATLEGHSASYFASASDLVTVDNKTNANALLIGGLTTRVESVENATTRFSQVISTSHGINVTFQRIGNVCSLEFSGNTDKVIQANQSYNMGQLPVILQPYWRNYLLTYEYNQTSILRFTVDINNEMVISFDKTYASGAGIWANIVWIN